MPFVSHGRRGKRAPPGAEKLEAEEKVIDYAVSASRVPLGAPGACLPACVFVERLLRRTLPEPAFALRLGSLHVGHPDGSDVLAFDPRPDDADTPHAWLEGRRGQPLEPGAPFHAWLQDRRGRMLDPSINVTLHSHGYKVNPGLYSLAHSRDFVLGGLRYLYEELPDLELRSDAESDAVMDSWVSSALTLQPFALDLIWPGDVGWRKSAARDP
jgi:hypothetical protein